jgi:hypothetical protein
MSMRNFHVAVFYDLILMQEQHIAHHASLYILGFEAYG